MVIARADPASTRSDVRFVSARNLPEPPAVFAPSENNAFPFAIMPDDFRSIGGIRMAAGVSFGASMVDQPEAGMRVVSKSGI
jgi:hypothetical protein